MDEPVENALTAALARGEESAFVEVYDRFASSLFRTASTFLGCRTEAEDAVQDVFVGLVRSRRELVGVANLRAYLFACLRHTVMRRAEHRRRHSTMLLDDVPEPVASPLVATNERADRLNRAVQSLPREQREIIALKVDGSLTFAEVAGIIGVSPNTAASRYRYALEKLRSALGEK